MNTRVDVTSFRSQPAPGISLVSSTDLVFCIVDLIIALDDEDFPIICVKEVGDLQYDCNQLIVSDEFKRPWGHKCTIYHIFTLLSEAEMSICNQFRYLSIFPQGSAPAPRISLV